MEGGAFTQIWDAIILPVVFLVVYPVFAVWSWVNGISWAKSNIIDDVLRRKVITALSIWKVSVTLYSLAGPLMGEFASIALGPRHGPVMYAMSYWITAQVMMGFYIGDMVAESVVPLRALRFVAFMSVCGLASLPLAKFLPSFTTVFFYFPYALFAVFVCRFPKSVPYLLEDASGSKTSRAV